MANQKLPSCEILTRLYWDKKLSQPKIAERYGVTRAAVSLAFKRLGIPTRTHSEALQNRWGIQRPPIEELRQLYCKQRVSAAAIGRRYGVSGETICRMLRECDIEVRSTRKLPDNEELERLHWEEEMSYGMIGERHGVSASVVSSIFKYHNLRRRTRLEAIQLAAKKGRAGRWRRKLPDDTELLRLYWDERMSMAMIAERFDVDPSNVWKKFSCRGLKRRTNAEAQKLRWTRKKNATTN